MITILNSIHKFEDKINQITAYLFFYHPYLAFMAMFIGMPLFILVAVTICAIIATLLIY